MKKALLAGILLFGCTIANAGEIRDIFTRTEDNVIDWAILTSVEAGYARDLINGQNMVVAQTPVLYVTPYLSADIGYVTAYDNKSRGSLMFGGSLRLNKLLEDSFPKQIDTIKGFIPEAGKYWHKLWWGPFVSKRFSDFDSTLIGGLKFGLTW